MHLIDTTSRLHLAVGEDGSGGVGESCDSRADNTRIIASPRPLINTSTTNSADVFTPLRGVPCPACLGPATCIGATTKTSTWKCLDDACAVVEFKIPRRAERVEVAL